jgi:tRNA (guanine-N1)-methyltransferase
MTWRATVLTLFPEMFPGPLGVSLSGKALASRLWELEARDIRASATDKHRSVDDRPAVGPAWCFARTSLPLPSMPPTHRPESLAS